jgi:hypothetical protein
MLQALHIIIEEIIMTERAYSGIYTHVYEYEPDMTANVRIHYTREAYTPATWNSAAEGGEIEITSLSIDDETLKGEILMKFQQRLDNDEVFRCDIIDYCFQNNECIDDGSPDY